MKLKPDNSHELISILLLLLLGLFAIGLQHSFVGMYYDDFGNASLSYGYVVEGVEGTDYTLRQLLIWARYCYLNWGGRVLYAVLFVIPLLKNGIDMYMNIQSIILIAICFISSSIICHYTDKKYRLFSILLLYIFYGLIGRDMHAHSTYWASASVLYIWPLLPLFFAILLYIKACEGIRNNQRISYGKLLPGLVLLLFFAACSQEQIGISLIVFFLFYIGFDHRKEWKRYRLLDGTAFGATVISYLLLFMAPGNFVRLNSSGEFSRLSFLGKLQYNLPRVLDLLFMKDFRVFNVLLLIAALIMGVYLFRRNRKCGILLGSTLFISLVYAGMLTKIIQLPYFLQSCFYFLFLLHFLGVAIAYFYATKRPQVSALIFTAGTSVFCLLYSPGVFERSAMEYLYLVFVLLAVLFIDTWERYSFYVLYRVAASAFVILLGMFSLLNFTDILKGYYRNAFYNDFNHEKLLSYNEEDGDMIFLAKLPNRYHRGEMPYDEGKDFIHEWYKEYYNLPENISIQWGSLAVQETFLVDGDFYDDGWFGESALITVLNDDLRELTFHYYASENSPQNPGLILRINGDETVMDLEPGKKSFTYAFPEAGEGPVEIQVKAASTFIPAEEGISDDIRELSIMLRISQ